MSLNWLSIVKMLFIMAIVLISEQPSLSGRNYGSYQIFSSESGSNIPIPPGFELNIEEARRLEELLQQDPTVIENLVGVYEDILARLPPGEYPVFRADIENSLGNAYYGSIRGDRAENIEMAIMHLNNSVNIRSRDADPVNWAWIENKLGNVYRNRIKGDRAENIEIAIQHFNNSLQIRARNADPSNWALTNNDLAIAYNKRIRGDRAENLEIAIELYSNSLQVYTRETDPVNWATTEYNLGMTYLDRIQGDRAENLETAIEHLNNSLQIRTRNADPSNWAVSENALGAAYYIRIRGNKSENIEIAIEHLNNSLLVMTHDANPIDWATVRNNLGIVYRHRILGNKAENIETAIEHFNSSLQVWTIITDPVSWARTENNLGDAYNYRIRGDQVENIEIAIQHYTNALQVRTANSMPRDFRQTESHLGDLYFELNRWRDALDTYNKAIAAGDQLYRSGLSAESKSEEVKENSAFYRNAAFAAVRLNETDEAFLILEQGKTRLLTESLRLSMKRPDGVTDEAWAKYKQAAETYRILQATPLKEISVKAQSDREQKSQEALRVLNAAIKDVQSYVPGFQKSLELSDIQNALDNETALLSFCVTDKGSIVFVVTQSGEVKSVDVPGFNITDLDSLIVEYDDYGNITGGWIGNMSQSTREITQATIDKVMIDIGQKLLEPAAAEIPEDIRNLILLPSGSLFLIPIHAAPLSDGQERLCDRYVVSYDPSIELLIEMREKAKERTGKGLYAVINPTGDLDFAVCEGERISGLFQNNCVDKGSSCTLTSVMNGTRGQAYLHFSCHGEYNWNDPTQSALILYNGSLLTLTDLQENDSLLISSRLVTLSACQTGITDVLVGSTNEYVGLPAGFMLSGAPCVMSSLWSVDDVSTSLLMDRFYSNHINKGMDIPSALQDAQQWVCGLTNVEVAEYVNECSGSINTIAEKRYLRHYERLAKEMPNATPFAHPYYWAGFTVNGA